MVQPISSPQISLLPSPSPSSPTGSLAPKENSLIHSKEDSETSKKKRTHHVHKWTPELDELLKKAVEDYGTAWTHIIENTPQFNGLSTDILRGRYFRHLNPKTVNKKKRKNIDSDWTDQAKKDLKLAFEMHGRKWKRVREEFPSLRSKTTDECFRYYNKHIIKKKYFSQNERDKIRKLYEIYRSDPLMSEKISKELGFDKTKVEACITRMRKPSSEKTYQPLENDIIQCVAEIGEKWEKIRQQLSTKHDLQDICKSQLKKIFEGILKSFENRTLTKDEENEIVLCRLETPRRQVAAKFRLPPNKISQIWYTSSKKSQEKQSRSKPKKLHSKKLEKTESSLPLAREILKKKDTDSDLISEKSIDHSIEKPIIGLREKVQTPLEGIDTPIRKLPTKIPPVKLHLGILDSEIIQCVATNGYMWCKIHDDLGKSGHNMSEISTEDLESRFKTKILTSFKKRRLKLKEKTDIASMLKDDLCVGQIAAKYQISPQQIIQFKSRSKNKKRPEKFYDVRSEADKSLKKGKGQVKELPSCVTLDIGIPDSEIINCVVTFGYKWDEIHAKLATEYDMSTISANDIEDRYKMKILKSFKRKYLSSDEEQGIAAMLKQNCSVGQIAAKYTICSQKINELKYKKKIKKNPDQFKEASSVAKSSKKQKKLHEVQEVPSAEIPDRQISYKRNEIQSSPTPTKGLEEEAEKLGKISSLFAAGVEGEKLLAEQIHPLQLPVPNLSTFALNFS